MPHSLYIRADKFLLFTCPVLWGHHTCPVLWGHHTASSLDHSTVSFEEQNFLKYLIAAVSGPVVLRELEDGSYAVNTLSLGDGSGRSFESVLEIVVDQSVSMNGMPINFVNQQLPVLLQRIKDALPKGKKIKVRITGFHENRLNHGAYMIQPDQNLPMLASLSANGRSTDLTCIEPSLYLEGDDQRKTVVAFTDGVHNLGQEKLNQSFCCIESKVRTGKFAQPMLVAVGTNLGDYFNQISEITGGKCYTQQDMPAFFELLGQNIQDLVRSKAPLVFELQGQKMQMQLHTEWVYSDVAGIFESQQKVRPGDSVKYEGQKYSVPANSVPTPAGRSVLNSNSSSDVSETDTAKAELLKQMATLQAQLDALNLQK